MDNILLIALVYLVGISLLLVLNELNYRYWKLQAEYSRKIAHVLATLATLPFPWLGDIHWFLLGLVTVFVIFMFVSSRTRFLNSIHDVSRKSYGSLFLPIAIYLTYLIYTISGDPLMYVLPMTVLSICDPAAAISGMSFQKGNVALSWPGRTSSKTLFGSGAFFIVSCLICFGYLNWLTDLPLGRVIVYSMLLSILSTLAELFSWRGSDNITIPLSVQVGLFLLL
ncbi:MAG TPA: hypothetical protein VKZ54_11575 [Membranihabitans sp.]|nr:hypothetical protein [Membranihabitans sp.]